MRCHPLPQHADRLKPVAAGDFRAILEQNQGGRGADIVARGNFRDVFGIHVDDMERFSRPFPQLQQPRTEAAANCSGFGLELGDGKAVTDRRVETGFVRGLFEFTHETFLTKTAPTVMRRGRSGPRPYFSTSR